MFSAGIVAPLDCADAELLPFLLVWLLEWANVPDAFWNREKVRGDFSAEDRDRRLQYLVAFELRSRHLSEGLYERTLTLSWAREGTADLRAPASPATKKA